MEYRCQPSRLSLVPPAPSVVARLYAEYLQHGKPFGLSFRDYLAVVAFTNPAAKRPGMDDGAHPHRVAAVPGSRPELIDLPSHPVQGSLTVKVLLVDFSDRVGSTTPSHYESMLFSKDSFATGSLRDFYKEASVDKVSVTGSVHGWLRLPNPYSYYANSQSGVGDTYPRNAQGMAEDAVKAALSAGVAFDPSLDVFGQGTVTALFIVHSGVGAESQSDAATRNGNIWSHKWAMPQPIDVAAGLQASVYLTVPHDAKVGVCAHELGHLAFQWEDFYDPNYDEDGSEWDGSGKWDLMAGGSWNGDGARPAHPAALHKLQHGWVDLHEVRSSGQVTLDPYSASAGRVVKIVSSQYRSGQYLLLENRRKSGFDTDLPGEGLLVWRVDEARDMFKPDRPALLLLQADGRHDLERASDWNEGDAGDPFPGSAGRVELDDQGEVSTTFPDGSVSGVRLANITRDAASGRVNLDIVFGASAPPPGTSTVITGRATLNLAIPDASAEGVISDLSLEGVGLAQELAVDVQIDHPYIGDLKVELIGPSGVSVVVHNRTGGNTHDLHTVYRSSTTPELQALVGEPAQGVWKLRVSDLASADTGVLRQWGIAISVDTGDTMLHERRTPALAIPDADPSGISDTISVTRSGKAKSIRVAVDISHPNVQDLRLELVGPSGQHVLLQDRAGGSADDLIRSFSSDDTPALAGLVGSDLKGGWALRVADLASRNVGTLNAWELEIGVASVTDQSTGQSIQGQVAPNLAVPDNTPAGIGSALTFTEVGTVQALELDASIEHPYIGDLRVELVAPGGLNALLHDRAGGRTQNLELHLSSATSSALAALSGQPLTGSWILRVADLATADVGVLRSWSLKAIYV